MKLFRFVRLNDDAIFKALSHRFTDAENLPFPAGWEINDALAVSIPLGRIRGKLATKP